MAEGQGCRFLRAGEARHRFRNYPEHPSGNGLPGRPRLVAAAAAAVAAIPYVDGGPRSLCVLRPDPEKRCGTQWLSRWPWLRPDTQPVQQ